ncbi:MAG: hypothetical protein GF353_11980, partial [Candidatus Lokiarchaeota archaeon]|nr:hypothetical protein [Candidatus Lokiarchaeota archaeon]
MISGDELKVIFSNSVELNIQTIQRKIKKDLDKDIDIEKIEQIMDNFIKNDVLKVRYSLKDPNEHTELKSFHENKLYETFLKSRNTTLNDITGEKYLPDELI